MIALPGYVDKEAWDALIEVRKAKKVPTTVYAAKLLLYELQRIKDAGHCPNAALRQSILKGYTDVYAPKEKQIERAAASAVDETRAYLDSLQISPEEKARQDAIRRRALGAVRRVA